jgi:hypothetical protein
LVLAFDENLNFLSPLLIWLQIDLAVWLGQLLDAGDFSFRCDILVVAVKKQIISSFLGNLLRGNVIWSDLVGSGLICWQLGQSTFAVTFFSLFQFLQTRSCIRYHLKYVVGNFYVYKHCNFEQFCCSTKSVLLRRDKNSFNRLYASSNGFLVNTL